MKDLFVFLLIVNKTPFRPMSQSGLVKYLDKIIKNKIQPSHLLLDLLPDNIMKVDLLLLLFPCDRCAPTTRAQELSSPLGEEPHLRTIRYSAADGTTCCFRDLP